MYEIINRGIKSSFGLSFSMTKLGAQPRISYVSKRS
jgi:hypothetical protein